MPATDTKGTRIRVLCKKTRWYVPWDHSLSAEANHFNAACAWYAKQGRPVTEPIGEMFTPGEYIWIDISTTPHRIAPVPNHYGSTKQALVEQAMQVHRALEFAAALMRQWQPHGRDYQIGGDYNADRAEFLRRLKIVETLASQYESEAYSLSTID